MARRPKRRVAKKSTEKQPKPSRRDVSMPPPPVQHGHNLPTQLTSFIGREQETAEIKRLLGTTRLLTLTGSGGCGKTRLALQVAADLVEQYPDGAWFVELASLSDPAFIPKAVASALDVPEQPKRPLIETLTSFLRTKTVLLLLDNCEHLRAACQRLIETVLRACATTRILATSREALGGEGELTYRVPPLRHPDVQRPLSPAQLTEYDAIRLFTERATFSQPRFAVTERSAPAIIEICVRLDGMPLAIEFAAARVRMLSVEQIAARLHDRFRLLTAGTRQTLPRQQTLRATMDWSYDLLSEPERAVLCRLSVFSGGWALEAAEAICTGGGVEASNILDLLTQLVDKSLVTAETRGRIARYRLLETIRQYSHDRLTESGEETEVQRRHRDWYLRFAERANSELHGPGQITWLERLEKEHDNLRVALGFGKIDAADPDVRLRLAVTLHQFWFMRGYFAEGREWLEGALAATRAPLLPERAWALCGAGMFAWRLGDVTGKGLLQDALVLFRQLQDPPGTAYALHHLAHVLEGQGDFARATEMFEESVAHFRAARDTWGIGWSLMCAGDGALLQGDDGRAMKLLQESLSLCREAGSTHTLSYLLDSLGTIARRRGDYDKATALLDEALEMAQQVGDKYHITTLLCGLADVASAKGHVGRAMRLYRECITLRQEVGDKPRLAVPLYGLARLASSQKDYQRAAKLFGAAEASLGPHLIRWRLDPADDERQKAAARVALGEELFESHWAEGRRMGLDAAIEYAVGAEKTQSLRSPGHLKMESTRRGVLAPREREVVALIAEGKTNRVIAAHLSITEGTAEAHVQHILNKLGFNSRAQIAAWAVEHGLRIPSPSPHTSTSDR
ncbi:MAG TPA: tetratricopeptide repeat protein [bacterium]|nr:tetratricopeptide repeat protein [bacterium]